MSSTPDAPTRPQPPTSAPSSGTSVLEREEVREQTSPGDDERYAHYVRKDKIAASAVTGQPVIALCGKVWTPGRDPKKYPVCPTCKAIFEGMKPGGDDGAKGRGWPFGGRRDNAGTGE
ncbi:DUF3039 domain-containing protein [Georgenia sp. TF02-10]|uniref:DUF3039 domain-containing protein n=1 Tax=Georgenia sp. TF02-10 TaxID=2917725 RepID=UPI001FA7127A|nr:DUF3039 domain-containing protein [Georgenia sp. TF02-10]UNX54138.1 DUF3039 domain-containing protein [Georgenia sp. TF02-10]